MGVQYRILTMGYRITLNPYWIIPFVIFVLVIIYRFVMRYLAHQKQQQHQNQDFGTTYPAYPTPTGSGVGGINQPTIGAGGFTQPTTPDNDDPPPYNVAVGYGFDQSKYGSGFDSSKYGGGFDSSKYTSDNNYDPISR